MAQVKNSAVIPDCSPAHPTYQEIPMVLPPKQIQNLIIFYCLLCYTHSPCHHPLSKHNFLPGSPKWSNNCDVGLPGPRLPFPVPQSLIQHSSQSGLFQTKRKSCQASAQNSLTAPAISPSAQRPTSNKIPHWPATLPVRGSFICFVPWTPLAVGSVYGSLLQIIFLDV